MNSNINLKKYIMKNCEMLRWNVVNESKKTVSMFQC